jgi:hypothetical protein
VAIEVVESVSDGVELPLELLQSRGRLVRYNSQPGELAPDLTLCFDQTVSYLHVLAEALKLSQNGGRRLGGNHSLDCLGGRGSWCSQSECDSTATRTDEGVDFAGWRPSVGGTLGTGSRI